MNYKGGIRGANKAMRVLSGIENCNGSFRQIWQKTGLHREDLKTELEVLLHLGFVEVVSRSEQGDGCAGPIVRNRYVIRTSSSYRVTDKGRRAFLSLD